MWGGREGETVPVLLPRVAELPVLDRRVDLVPVNLEEVFVRNDFGVVENLQALGVAGDSRGDLPVRRAGLVAPGVPGRGREDARGLRGGSGGGEGT